MDAKDFTLTKDFLWQIFDYKDGDLYWKQALSKNYRLVGMKVGYASKSSTYVQVSIKRKKYYVHRIIFFMFNDFNPKSVDHIDGNPRNNRIENLRNATFCQNQYNKKLSKNNTSGVKGVYFNKTKNKWIARCGANRKENYLGEFDNIFDAEKAVQQYRQTLHGEFSRNF